MNLALENHLNNLKVLDCPNGPSPVDFLDWFTYYSTINFETTIYKLIHPFWSELFSQFATNELVLLPFIFESKIKNPFYINNQLKIIGLFDIFIRPQLKFAKYHSDIAIGGRFSVPYLILLLPRIISALSVLLIRLITIVPMYLCNLLFNRKEKEFLSKTEYEDFYNNVYQENSKILGDEILESQRTLMGYFYQAKETGRIQREPIDLKKEVAMFNVAIGFFGPEKQQHAKESFQKAIFNY